MTAHEAARVGWLDLSSGASGDMLLGALVGAGVPLEVVRDALEPLGVPVAVDVEAVRRAGLAATRAAVSAPETGQPRRTLADVRTLLAALPDEGARGTAERVFETLATAEARVHGTSPDEVHFHEVGALDALADVVGVVAAVRHLRLDRLVASPVALGGGTTASAHGRLPVPAPAVLELVRAARLPTAASVADVELCTPTGAALVSTLADGFGAMPAMTVRHVGVGAGARDRDEAPNVVRLVVGDGAPGADGPPAAPAVVLEANVDDLDPRVWPTVVAALLAAGAADAWLTPVLMKKGRPAHVLSALVAPHDVGRVRELIYRQTSTLGVRETTTTKRPLARDVAAVEVEGHRIAVKRGFLPDGTLVTAQPEWEDIAAAATALGRSARDVLAAASDEARRL